MSNVPGLSRLAPPDAKAASMEIPPGSGEIPRRTWKELLRPQFIEHSVLVADYVFIVLASLVFSLTYHLIATGDINNEKAFFSIGIIVAANFTAMMAARRNYRLKNLTLLTRQARDTIIIWCGVFGTLTVVAFTLKVSNEFSRGAATLFFAGGLATLLSWRYLVANRISHALANGSFARKKIIIITERGLNASSRPLNELRRYGYHPIQTCEVSKDEISSLVITGSLRSKLADVIELAKCEQIEDIYLLIGWQHRHAIDGILSALAVLPISVHLIPDESAARFLNHPISNVGSTWTTELQRAPMTRAELAAKRVFDVGLATAALITLLPLMLVTALLIKLDSRGPVLFLQKRNGFNGRAFNIFKFRTMHVLEDGPVIQQATRNDPRVTRLGRWLRRSSIDELPQLLNVILDDMSLVGPRPHATSHNSEYEKVIANYAFRHHVKPGLTGWAQVNGLRGETTQIEQMERRVEHDLWYINNWSPLLDLRIVLQTIVTALRQTTAY
ncbi:undecaprenyl-phosphate glucose phosphotransferase [Bradyrhizobium canariense]|uniref:Undecaprenyl-phosphate galactose phosphotransferase/putative colanic acid biosysnthesis UDP-glucose lipid carrier transferase n=1 Tax=Bradyrhizobium canariense TaxID=255045 RepID=A0A1H2BNS0_9BRAD|nr:undecaprenyl-phosphate glucose phosphotransferase [Bradyrhizobium canariense]SDT59707.1 undecaprenyl-phosphate galactose phosphotransferase/putative colanic acid biosysnthesis UDP-glucose lipid carrier transferase [Bradyrhizobium canariense]